MDLHFQGLKDSYFAGMEQYEERQTAYSDNHFGKFQKLSMLIRGDQNIVTSADHTDDPHSPPQPYLLFYVYGFDRMRFSALIWFISLIEITASDIAHHINLANTIFKLFTFDVEFVIIKKGEIESVHVKRNTLESSPYMTWFDEDTCANMSLKIINKSTCLSLPIVKKNLPNQPGGLDVVCGGQANEPG
ncbi:hypothetical protein Lal_00044189 [Lupinus albus]|nr:hypothetical protein Lal_00044189 [Lupinus albus]